MDKTATNIGEDNYCDPNDVRREIRKNCEQENTKLFGNRFNKGRHTRNSKSVDYGVQGLTTPLL